MEQYLAVRGNGPKTIETSPPLQGEVVLVWTDAYCPHSRLSTRYSGTVSPEPPNSFGKSFSLGNPSFIRQNRLRVVHVHRRRKLERRQRRREHIHHSQRRMIGHQMAAAFLAVLAMAQFGFLEGCDIF